MKTLTMKGLCRSFLLALATLFLLGAAPGGYTCITAAKLVLYLALAGLFAAGALYCALRGAVKIPGRGSPAALPLLLFWLWSLLSALLSPWAGKALLFGCRDEGMLTLTLYCLSFLLLAHYALPEKRLLYVFAGAMSLNCLLCIWQLLDGNPLGLFPGQLRWSGRYQDYNGAFLGLTGNAGLGGALLCMAFPAFWAGALRLKKHLLLLPAALCLGVLLCSEVRGAQLGALAGSLLALPVVLPLQRRGKRRLLLALLLLLLCLLALIYLHDFGGTLGEAHALLHGRAEDGFGSGRIFIWRHVWKLLPERLLLGGGPDTLGLRMTEAFTRVLPDGSILTRSIDCAHNEYLNILVNQGLVGLLCYLAALGVSLLRWCKSRSDAAAITGACLLCYCIQAFFGISMPANGGFFWALWGLLEASLRLEAGEET